MCILSKKARVLSLFIFWPKLKQKSSNTGRIVSAYKVETSTKRIRSSTKNKWEMGGLSLPRKMGFHKPLWTESVMPWASLSIQRTNKYGDKGLSYLRPLVGWNFSAGTIPNDLHRNSDAHFITRQTKWEGSPASIRVPEKSNWFCHKLYLGPLLVL